jgi:carbon-monoxide dehydrogenase medium subunit
MKPCRFDYARPRDLAGALELIARNGLIKVIAGGQSLGPMLNLRLVEPDLLVDIAGVPELRVATVESGRLVLGACVTHSDIEDGRVPDVTAGAMARVARTIAYRAVRNRGTVGGSLVHADPAADWVTALAALDAEVELASPQARRRVPLSDFVVAALDVALEPGELLLAVRVPALSSSVRWGYVKHCRKVGEFAHAIGCVALDPSAGSGRAVIGAVEAAPVILDARPLFGGRIDHDFAARFDARVADAALIEAGIADAVDRHVHVTVLRRAVMQASGLTVRADAA